MTWHASAWASELTTGNVWRKAAIMIMCEQADDWGYTYAGQESIATRSEMSERQARRVIYELARLGFLQIFQRHSRSGNRHNLYRLCYRPKSSAAMPDIHVSHLEGFKLLSGPEPFKLYKPPSKTDPKAEPPDCQSGGAVVDGNVDETPGNVDKAPSHRTDSPVVGGEPPDHHDKATGLSVQNHRTPQSGDPILTDYEHTPAPAREAAPPDGAAPPAGDPAKTPTALARDHWQDCLPKILDALFAEQAAWRHAIAIWENRDATILVDPDIAGLGLHDLIPVTCGADGLVLASENAEGLHALHDTATTLADYFGLPVFIRQAVDGERFHRHAEIEFAAWIKDICVESGDPKNLILAVPTPMFVQVIEARYGELIEVATDRSVDLRVRPWAGKAIDRHRLDDQIREAG